MSEPEAAYANDPPGGTTAHLFRETDVEAAGLAGNETDKPVKSVCGTVRSYGPFDPDPVGDVCQNCANKLAAQNDD